MEPILKALVTIKEDSVDLIQIPKTPGTLSNEMSVLLERVLVIAACPHRPQH